jgi:hypothetical protein
MRLPDWQMRFSDFGKARASMPFSWGSNDCCTFAAAAVEAITGTDLMALVAPYETELAAARLIKDGGGLQQIAASLLGQPVAPNMAAVGDVVLFINEGREMLGICNGVNVMAPGESGMVALGMDAAVAAWKI